MGTRDTELLIGSRAGEHLRVVPLRRAYAECSDYWDGNWVDALVELFVGAFRASYIANLRTDELVSFRNQLEPLCENLFGKANFSSIEHWLSIEIVGDRLGHFLSECEASDKAGIRNRLKFDLSFDQTEAFYRLGASDIEIK